MRQPIRADICVIQLSGDKGDEVFEQIASPTVVWNESDSGTEVPLYHHTQGWAPYMILFSIL